ncbi:MAG: diaminopimelate epimerase, partial [Muribaculaceae bacterium]|nr:diaminopimelate epimerase [Muribaculaceae bacterium]
GITMACGTGACASVAVAVANGLTDEKVRVHLDGGDLDIFWDRSSGHIFLTGTAKTVFTGIYGI